MAVSFLLVHYNMKTLEKSIGSLITNDLKAGPRQEFENLFFFKHNTLYVVRLSLLSESKENKNPC